MNSIFHSNSLCSIECSTQTSTEPSAHSQRAASANVNLYLSKSSTFQRWTKSGHKWTVYSFRWSTGDHRLNKSSCFVKWCICIFANKNDLCWTLFFKRDDWDCESSEFKSVDIMLMIIHFYNHLLLIISTYSFYYIFLSNSFMRSP